MVPDGTTPLAPSTGVTVKPVPPQTVVVIAVITGLGLTVTVTVNDDPRQLPTPEPPVGVTVYTAVAARAPVFVNVPVIFVGLPLLAAPPENPEPDGADHEYVVAEGTIPFVPSAGVTVKALPPHAVAVIALIIGLGLTVTVVVNDDPTQLPTPEPPVGVTV